MPRKAEPRLSNRVRELREGAGWTQQALADHAGVTRQTIVALEKGAYVPSLALAIRVSRAFDEIVESVFHLDE